MNSVSVMAGGREIRAARVIGSAPMLRDLRRLACTIVSALAVTIATSSCGIKGPLTLPPKASPPGADAPAESKPAAPKAPAL
jgi:predicted small lipoprotein YifL